MTSNSSSALVGTVPTLQQQQPHTHCGAASTQATAAHPSTSPAPSTSTSTSPDAAAITAIDPTAHCEDQTKEIAPFLRSLRRMLDRESDEILCWTPDGLAFEIHDLVAMTSYIIPKYFKHAKYTSFQRQLNYFNFRKWTKSRAVVCTFSNAFFVRDQPDLTWRITRKRGLSDAKHTDGCSSGGSTNPSVRSPKTPKPRASSTSAPTSKPTVTTTTSKPTTLKREVTGTKRKAPSAAPPARKVAKVAKVTTRVTSVKVEATTADASVESLEWVDTLYPSLEALEAECSTSSSAAPLSFATPVCCTNTCSSATAAAAVAGPSIVVPAPITTDYSYHNNLNTTMDDGASSSYSYGSGSYYSEQVAYAWPQYSPTVEDAERFRPAASYFAPTVVQTSCVAL